MHEVVRYTRAGHKVQNRMITHGGHLYQHVRMRDKDDRDTNEIGEEVDVHYTTCIHLKEPTLLLKDMEILERHFNF